MGTQKDSSVEDKRAYYVSKRNDLIQKAKFDLSIQEQRLLGYVFSKIKPTDTSFRECEFTVKEYLQICGMVDSGRNYEDIKKAIKSLRDKSFWVTDENGNYQLYAWINDADIYPGSGTIRVEINSKIEKFLIGLQESGQYTQYSFIYTLPMRSTYSYRIYELLKSFDGFPSHTFDIDVLKEQLAAESYKNFKDFRVNVLTPATREINLYTDLEVSWEPIKDGKRVAKIKFKIKKREGWEKAMAEVYSNKMLDGQLTLEDIQKREEEIKKAP